MSIDPVNVLFNPNQERGSERVGYIIAMTRRGLEGQ